jgi:hypothetical protein
VKHLNTNSNKKCIKLLREIFSQTPSLYQVLAPNGWSQSEYIKFLHPTPEQQLEEHTRISESLRLLSKKPIPENDKPPKKLADFQQDDLALVNGYEECIYLLGVAVYHIFSNNHEVTGLDNKVYDLGSMRGSARFIAEFINTQYPRSDRLDYIDFYTGSIWIEDRADWYPFYHHVFTVLKEFHCQWKYSFPRLYLVDFSASKPPTDNPVDYKPEQVVEEQLKKDESINSFRNKLDKAHDEAYEEAKYKPLPPIVKAYKDVYGVLPEGHPQKEFE